MSRLFASMLFAACVPACAATAPAAPFDPAAHKLQSGRINEVMVLGTPHLSQLPKSFDASQLSALNARLLAWRPQAIAIEALSGLQCAYLRSYPQRYAGAIKSYCWDPAAAQAATGLDVVAATVQTQRLLAAWPAAPSAGQRRTLASLFLAGGERASALVQWLRLPEAERRAGDGLDAALVVMLNVLLQRRGEDMLIAAVVAAKSGHEQVYAMDDHTSDAPADTAQDEKAYGEALMRVWDNPHMVQRKRIGAELVAASTTPAAVLAMYRAYNASDQAEMVFRSDFGAALEEVSPQQFGRNYVAYWETRNLRMASNIREVMMARPGMRVLVVVGVSHKAYLEAYLRQMHDVRIVGTDAVLRQEG
ncbi:MAG: DUF5694 domain-containing protein [Janthinobacterium sp.]|uniref:DUF5694 domain-containing protein n=1 Tax=Janthinobacterium sp. FT68W TaxID=2654255 RepID=UPI0012649A50|nr:DUF5694 domain-containing protein [Janthinobacterium sp. FT68W]KAB8048144.1 hypothetical protein GCN78_20390 [Janthinobacterium sp. FT68W]